MVGILGGKHKYPKGRKPPIAHNKKRPKGIIYAQSKNKRKMTEWMLILLSYAPLESTIYTVSYGNSEANRYQYMDIYAIYDDKLYKVTSIVANILHFVTLDRHYRFTAYDTLAVRTGKEHHKQQRAEILALEKDVVTKLNKKMFKSETGFKHVSLLGMLEYTTTTNEESIPKDEPEKKTYILRKPVDRNL